MPRVAALSDSLVTLGSPYLFSFTVEVAPPPPLPSSFHGEVHILDNPPVPGDTVQILVPGLSAPIASAAIYLYETNQVYSVDVPGDIFGTSAREGGTEGELLTFKVNGRIVATGFWHKGSSVQLDLHPPEALTGSPYSGIAGTAIDFSGAANDFGMDAVTYQWDWNNDGTYDETGQNPSHSWPNVGSYPIGLKVTDSQGGQGTASASAIVNPIPATLELGNLNPTYTGSPLAVNITTNPPGLEVSLTYDGLPTAPTNVGSYAVVATITSTNYTGSTSGTLNIAKAASAVFVSCPPVAQTYTGFAIEPCSASYSGAGGLSGSLTPGYINNVTIGTATASATYLGDLNHTGSNNSATFEVGKASLTITARDQTKTYGISFSFLGTEFTTTGLLHTDSVSGVTLSSDGSADSANVGDYDIVASAATGTGLGNYTIHYQIGNMSVTPASATIILSDLVQIYDGTPRSVSFTTSPPGLAISLTYDGLSTPPTNPGSYAVAASIANTNYTGSASATLVIKASISLSLVPGWNLVSFNVIPDDTNITVVLADISGHFNLVYAWDATGASSSSGNWMKFDPNAPGYQNSLKHLDEKMGFWIFMSVADTLDILGSAPTTTTIPLTITAAGWNLVAYPSIMPRSMPSALRDHGVGTNFALAYAYHAGDLADPWKLFDPAATYSNDLRQLDQGWGYWIKVNSASDWSIQFLPD